MPPEWLPKIKPNQTESNQIKPLGAAWRVQPLARESPGEDTRSYNGKGADRRCRGGCPHPPIGVPPRLATPGADRSKIKPNQTESNQIKPSARPWPAVVEHGRRRFTPFRPACGLVRRIGKWRQAGMHAAHRRAGKSHTPNPRASALHRLRHDADTPAATAPRGRVALPTKNP